MLISSEIPVEYLNTLGKLNDYPFIINIYRDIPEYREYYIKACQESDLSYLDSGFFENWENGTNFDTSINALDEGVEIFHPKYVFSEEKFGDADYTINKAKEFKEHFKDRVKIATCIHGNTYEEFRKCFREINEISDLIAFSHKFAFHDEILKECPSLKCDNKYMEQSLVRIYTIHKVLNDEPHDKPIHLLGCNNPIEIRNLCMYSDFISADTSSPVVYGANGFRYNDMGILPNGKMHQGINYMDRKLELTEDNINNIKYNFEWLKLKLKIIL